MPDHDSKQHHDVNDLYRVLGEIEGVAKQLLAVSREALVVAMDSRALLLSIAENTKPSQIWANGGILDFGPPTIKNQPRRNAMATRPANWSIGEGYDAVVTPTRDDPANPGTTIPGKIQPGSGKFTSTDPACVITQIDDTHARIDATANSAPTVNWDADGDLGSGAAPIHLEGVPVFSDADVEATGGAMDFGEPTTKGGGTLGARRR